MVSHNVRLWYINESSKSSKLQKFTSISMFSIHVYSRFQGPLRDLFRPWLPDERRRPSSVARQRHRHLRRRNLRILPVRKSRHLQLAAGEIGPLGSILYGQMHKSFVFSALQFVWPFVGPFLPLRSGGDGHGRGLRGLVLHQGQEPAAQGAAYAQCQKVGNFILHASQCSLIKNSGESVSYGVFAVCWEKNTVHFCHWVTLPFTLYVNCWTI